MGTGAGVGAAGGLIRDGRFTEARQVVDAAAALHLRDGDSELAAACLRLAGVLSQLVGDEAGAGSRRSRADSIDGGVRSPGPGIDRRAAREAVAAARAQVAGDHVSLSQLAMLDVALHLDERDVASALTAAETARTEALSGGAPIEYLAASVAIAELADHEGDRARAYRVMAVALVTLADVVGSEAARGMAEPELVELRRRWGADAFGAVKAQYEAGRRSRQGVQ